MSLWQNDRSRHGGIDRIPLPGSPGKLWLCGKHAIGPDVEAAIERVAATTVVCLNEEFELRERYPDYVRWLRANVPGRAVWFPIPDLHAPSLVGMRRLLDDVAARLVAGERVLAHCGAGMGRAGTLAVCLLIDMGVSRDDALRTVAANRPMAGPEVGAQLDLVDAVAAAAASTAASAIGEAESPA